MQYKGSFKEWRIDIHHENDVLTFLYPDGPGTFTQVAHKIDSFYNHQKPTFSQNCSLVHSAWQNKDNPHAQKIITLLRDDWLWSFNGIAYVPNQGVFIEDNPRYIYDRVLMFPSNLIKRLEAGDKTVRFVPFGFKTGEQSARELSKNAFIIALAGEEGAEKLAQVCGKYPQKPILYTINNVIEKTITIPSLCSHKKIYIGCDANHDDSGGYAYAILPKD